MATRNQAVKTAIKYLGAKQGSKRHKKLVDTFNGVRPHGEKGTYTCAWCAIAWTAWSLLAGMTDKETPMSYNCGTLISDAKKLGVWVENDNYLPKKGDGIIYDWSDTGYPKENKDGASHVGMVVKVSGNSIKVIEGNYSTLQKVAYRTIHRNQIYIRGWITPKYSTNKAKKVINKAIANADKWAKNNKFHYVNYESGDKKTQQCPICHPELQKVKKYCGWNCIGFVSACYHHAGVKTVDCRAGGIVNDGFAEYTNITEEKFRKRNGNCWKLIYKKKEHCPTSKLKKGDVCICYQAGTSTFKHIVLYAGDGYIYDSTSGRKDQVSKRKYSSLGTKCYVVFRYSGE